MSFQSPCRRAPCSMADHEGFTLVELLLALCLGVGLCGAILQILLQESQLGARINQSLRERNQQQRTLALIRQDIQVSQRISSDPQNEQHACPLTGRLPVLHLSTDKGTITYSVGAAPSSIWRGQVLMRCGPAFDLEGQLSAGSTAQNRVVIDALAAKPESWTGCADLLGGTGSAGRALDLASSSRRPFSACLSTAGTLIGLRLVQDLPLAQKAGQAKMSSIELIASNVS